MEIIYDLYTDALLFSHRGKTLLLLRTRNFIATIWSLKISKKSSIASTPSHSVNIPKFVPYAVHTAMYLSTTLSYHRQAMIRRTIRRHHHHRKAQHLPNTHQQRHSHPHHRHSLTPKMMVFRTHLRNLSPKTTPMTCIFNISK